MTDKTFSVWYVRISMIMAFISGLTIGHIFW